MPDNARVPSPQTLGEFDRLDSGGGARGHRTTLLMAGVHVHMLEGSSAGTQVTAVCSPWFAERERRDRHRGVSTRWIR
jgi:hypothetical protein